MLYLSYDGLTDPLGQSQVLPYVIGLSRKGYRFTIVSFEKPERYKQNRTEIEKICGEAGIVWKPMAYTKRPPVLSTLWDLWRLKLAIRNIMRKQQIDLMHCRSYLTTLVALGFKRRNGIPFLFDMRGFWADERVDGKIWNLWNPLYLFIYRYFKHMEKVFLKNAAAVVSLTHAGKAELPGWFTMEMKINSPEYSAALETGKQVVEKTTVIPCMADLDHFDYRRISEDQKQKVAERHHIDPAEIYLGYVGSLGTWYMVEEMVQFYSFLYKAYPDVKFLVVSQDPTESLVHLFYKYDVPLVNLYSTSATRADMPALMSFMTAAVFFILPVYSKLPSSPTKQGELMGMGVPVICNDGVGDVDAIIEHTGSGILVKVFSDSEFERVSGLWDKLILIPKSEIRQSAYEVYDISKGLEEYLKIYKEILEKA